MNGRLAEIIRTVEYDPGSGWIARSPFDGRELGGDGFRWRTRDVARTVVEEERLFKGPTAGRLALSDKDRE